MSFAVQFYFSAKDHNQRILFFFAEQSNQKVLLMKKVLLSFLTLLCFSAFLAAQEAPIWSEDFNGQ